MGNNRDDWQPLLGELQRRTAEAEAMGGADKVQRQHQRGRLTARERVSQFCDADSFNEIGALAGGNHPAGQPALAADGLVAGSGRVNGRPVLVLAEDFTVKGGSIGHANAAKRSRLVRLAAEDKIPLVLMLDGAGERASNAAERYPIAPSDLQLLADLKGQVPVVTLVLGTSAGHGALTGMFADLIIMQQDAAMFTAGPPLVQAALGIESTPEELGGARMHATVSGVAHNLAATEQEAFTQARYFLSLLPLRCGESPPHFPVPAQATEQDSGALLDIIPIAANQAYDMQAVIATLADADSTFELQALYGRNLVCSLARIGGHPCMIVANQPAVQAGAITREAAEKATHFIDVAAAFGLPLLMLLDNPGVMPGPEAERSGVLRAAGQMFAAQRRYRGRKIVVTLRKAFGFGSSVMGMNPFDNQAISLALPSVSLGGIPAIGGAAAAGASEEEAEQMQEQQAGAWVPADAMAFDKVVDPAALRAEILQVLERNR
ncbi:MAG: carboxyl transferase domain-containing protein [Marinobacter sp.]|uniref:acyl-CoA carboxylase subunit beta n=1 Tax=Marinobacter sp. TaxID=50741 RepID=UPI00329855D5